jgi:hypothetical protein
MPRGPSGPAVGALNVGDGLGWRGARERPLDGTSQKASPLKPVERPA